jgi:hypothetical protein
MLRRVALLHSHRRENLKSYIGTPVFKHPLQFTIRSLAVWLTTPALPQKILWLLREVKESLRSLIQWNFLKLALIGWRNSEGSESGCRRCDRSWNCTAQESKCLKQPKPVERHQANCKHYNASVRMWDGWTRLRNHSRRMFAMVKQKHWFPLLYCNNYLVNK